MDESSHQFKPYGYTIAYTLSESHLTIHTYPEYKSCYIDVFCCSSDFNPITALNYIAKSFSAGNISHVIVYR